MITYQRAIASLLSLCILGGAFGPQTLHAEMDTTSAKLIERLPDYGIALLTRIKNETEFDADIQPDATKGEPWGLHDRLPTNTVIVLQPQSIAAAQAAGVPVAAKKERRSVEIQVPKKVTRVQRIPKKEMRTKTIEVNDDIGGTMSQEVSVEVEIPGQFEEKTVIEEVPGQFETKTEMREIDVPTPELLANLFYQLMPNPEQKDVFVWNIITATQKNNDGSWIIPDKATRFTVKRFLDNSLQDWVGLVPAGFNNRMLCVLPDGKISLKDGSVSFTDSDTGTPFHWKVEGKSLTTCVLRSQQSDGFMFQNIETEEITTKPADVKIERETALWTVEHNSLSLDTYFAKPEQRPVKYGDTITLQSIDSGKFISYNSQKLFYTADAAQKISFKLASGGDILRYNVSATLYALGSGSGNTVNTWPIWSGYDSMRNINLDNSNNHYNYYNTLYVRKDKEPYTANDAIMYGDTISLWGVGRHCWVESTDVASLGAIQAKPPRHYVTQARYYKENWDWPHKNITNLFNAMLDAYGQIFTPGSYRNDVYGDPEGGGTKKVTGYLSQDGKINPIIWSDDNDGIITEYEGDQWWSLPKRPATAPSLDRNDAWPKDRNWQLQYPNDTLMAKQPYLVSQYLAQPTIFKILAQDGKDPEADAGYLPVGKLALAKASLNNECNCSMASIISDDMGWAVAGDGQLLEIMNRTVQPAGTGFGNKTTLWVSAGGNLESGIDPATKALRKTLDGGVWCIVQDQDLAENVVYTLRSEQDRDTKKTVLVKDRPFRFGNLYQRIGDADKGYSWVALDINELGGVDIQLAEAQEKKAKESSGPDLSSAMDAAKKATAGISDEQKRKEAEQGLDAASAALAQGSAALQNTTKSLDDRQKKFNGFIRMAVRNDNEVWVIDNRFQIRCIQNGGQARLVTAGFGGDAIDISVSQSGEVWAVSNDGRIFRLQRNTSQLTSSVWAAPAATKTYRFHQVAVRNAKEVYALAQREGEESRALQLLTWDSRTWQEVSTGKVPSFVAVASGTKTVEKAPAATEIKSVKALRTRVKVSNPKEPTKNTFSPYTNQAIPTAVDADLANIGIQVVQGGMGGGIARGSGIDFGPLQMRKNKPIVKGFARDTLDDKAITQATVIGIGRLMNKGAGWFDTTFSTPNRGALSFYVKTQNRGNAQIMLGDQPNDKPLYAITIGGDQNTSANIAKFSFNNDGDWVPNSVHQVKNTQTLRASTTPGRWCPYWVSYDNGLIMVGMGEVGTNIFMAWRDPKKPSSDVRYVGLGSNDQEIGYMECRQTAPVVAKKPVRAYAMATASVSLGKNPVFQKLPLRATDRGMVGFAAQGTQQLTILLAGRDKDKKINLKNAHYRLQFGYQHPELQKTGLLIQRWTPGTKDESGKYKEVSFVDETTNPHAKLNKNGCAIWMSYERGQLVIGRGAISNKTAPQPFFAWDDLGAPTGMRFIGFGSQDGGSVSKILITPPIELGIEDQDDDYSKVVSPDSYFRGGMTIVLPFAYKLDQVDSSVTCKDAITNQLFYSAGVPERGAQYPFMAIVDAQGNIDIKATRAPTNEKKAAIARRIFTLQADAAKKRQEGTQIAADAMNAQALAQSMVSVAGIEAQSARELASAQAQMIREPLSAVSGAATSAAQAFGFLGQGPTPIHIGVGAAGAISLSAVAMSVSPMLVNAAAEDRKGAQAATAIMDKVAKGLGEAAKDTYAAQQQQIKLQQEADKLEYNAKLLQGESNIAFQSGDQYVYTDKGVRQQLGGATPPPYAEQNRQIAIAKINEAGQYFNRLDEDSMLKLNNALSDALSVATNYFVIFGSGGGDTYTKTKLIDGLENLYKTYKTLKKSGKTVNPILHNNLIKLFVRAFNNAYLTDPSNAEEAAQRREWYFRFNALARELLTTNQMREIEIPACFGEYIWLPTTLPTGAKDKASCSITFKVSGNRDIMIGLAKENAPTRNTDNELYEVVFAANGRKAHSIRIKSLDKPVSTQETTKYMPKEQEDEFTEYWVSLSNGLVAMGIGSQPGKNTLMRWQDPYPTKGIKYIGISSWSAPLVFQDIKITSDASAKTTTTPTATSTKAKTTPATSSTTTKAK